MAENRLVRQSAYRVGIVFLGLFAGGTVGYSILEGWKPFDALYMTVITLATVGYGEFKPLSEAGRAFTMGLIIVGVGNAAYALGTMTQFFATGGWEAYRRRARLEKKLDQVSGHTIICGYGRLGSTIAASLTSRDAPFVIVERNAEIVARLSSQDDIAFVAGDALDDGVLDLAGIKRAKALVAALNDDAANVFITLTARVLNPQIVIYGKADDPSTLVKLERAGANHMFSPSMVAGNRIAQQILRPAITDLVEIATGSGSEEFAIEEIPAGDVKDCTGRALQNTPFWGKREFFVVAIRDEARKIVFRPQGDHVLTRGDRVIVMGHPDAIAKALGNAA